MVQIGLPNMTREAARVDAFETILHWRRIGVTADEIAQQMGFARLTWAEINFIIVTDLLTEERQAA